MDLLIRLHRSNDVTDRYLYNLKQLLEDCFRFTLIVGYVLVVVPSLVNRISIKGCECHGKLEQLVIYVEKRTQSIQFTNQTRKLVHYTMVYLSWKPRLLLLPLYITYISPVVDVIGEESLDQPHITLLLCFGYIFSLLPLTASQSAAQFVVLRIFDEISSMRT